MQRDKEIKGRVSITTTPVTLTEIVNSISPHPRSHGWLRACSRWQRRTGKVQSEKGLLCTTPLHCADDLDEERRRSSLPLIAPHPRTSRQGQGTLTVATSHRHGEEPWIGKALDETARATTLVCTFLPLHLRFRVFRETELGEERNSVLISARKLPKEIIRR